MASSLDSPPTSTEERIVNRFLAGSRMRRVQRGLFCLRYVHRSSCSHTATGRVGFRRLAVAFSQPLLPFFGLELVGWPLSPPRSCCALLEGRLLLCFQLAPIQQSWPAFSILWAWPTDWSHFGLAGAGDVILKAGEAPWRFWAVGKRLTGNSVGRITECFWLYGGTCSLVNYNRSICLWVLSSSHLTVIKPFCIPPHVFFTCMFRLSSLLVVFNKTENSLTWKRTAFKMHVRTLNFF